MAVAKLTKSVVDKLPAGSILWDAEVVGFGVRAGKRKHYLLRYRLNGRQTFRRIGTHGSPYTVDMARNEARRLLGLLAGGENLAPARNEGATFASEAQRYLTVRERDARANTHKQLRYYLFVLAKPLHSLALGEINRRMVAELLSRIEIANGPTQRNRFRSGLSAFFSWCIREGLLEANVVTGTGKAAEAGSRERVLAPDEIRSLWRALGEDGWSQCLRLLLLTGCRKEEIAALRWSEVDFDNSLLRLPAERVKNGREHTLPLSDQAMAVLRRVASQTKSQTKNDGRVFEGVSWAHRKELLDVRLGIAAWRTHDLRRTCATGLGELGVSPWIVEAALNHVSGSRAGVAGIYNRSKLTEPMRDALQKYADWIDKITA